MTAKIEIELVQRTPFLLAYLVCKADGSFAKQPRVEIDSARLEADAAGWRDRPIHKLVSTRVVTHTDARRLFQGIGLVDAAHAGAMRGRLWIVSDTADPWGVCAILRGERAAILIDVPTVQHETMAIVTLEIERNR